MSLDIILSTPYLNIKQSCRNLHFLSDFTISFQKNMFLFKLRFKIDAQLLILRNAIIFRILNISKVWHLESLMYHKFKRKQYLLKQQAYSELFYYLQISININCAISSTLNLNFFEDFCSLVSKLSICKQKLKQFFFSYPIQFILSIKMNSANY